jgi:hypothetical protein
MSHSLIGVEAINVQQIHRSIWYIGKCIVEGAAEQFGKGTVTVVMETTKIQKDFLAVLSRLIVALPSIDSIATSIESIARHRLAKGGIRDAVLRAKFD